MFDASITGDKKKGTLTLKGELTLSNIHRVKEALLDVFSRFKKINIRIENLEHIDFSCFQLFCAAYKSAVKQGKSMVITPPPGTRPNLRRPWNTPALPR
jgi:anti-anti-sigma factor